MERLKQVPVLGTVVRMQQRYVSDAADALAASIGFFGFLSLFPLLALALAVVGQVLSDDPTARMEAVDLVTSSVPALSSIAGGDGEVASAIEAIADNPGALFGFGTITLVISGLKIASGAQQASAVVFRREVPTGVQARLWQFIALVSVGVVAVAGTAVTSTVGATLGGGGVVGVATTALGIAVGFALDLALFLLAYRLFTPGDGPEWSTLLPGSILAATGWTALKLFGSSYVASQAESRGGGGAVGSIIALLLLFYLAGRLYLYGAELAALLSDVDEDHFEASLLEEAERVPQVSSRPIPDVSPAPSDAARLATSSVVLGAAAAVLAKVLRR